MQICSYRTFNNKNKPYNKIPNKKKVKRVKNYGIQKRKTPTKTPILHNIGE